MGLRHVFILGLWICLCQLGWAKHKPTTSRAFSYVATPAVIYGADQLANELSRIVSTETSNADIAVYVKSMRYGDSLYTRNIYQPLTPASTLKILTAEAALIYLGPDYRFSTQLLTDAKSVKNGVLQGNLYVVLSGDPSLTQNDLEELLEALKSEQIRSIAGNVYIDNTAYDQSFYGPGWVWKDRSYCYGAPISASIINRNCMATTVMLPVKKTKRRGKSLAKRHYYGVSYVVTDVPEYNRSLFKSMLSRMSISVYGSVTFGSAPDKLSMINSHASKPLRALINEMLKKSDNVIAGALFKKLGQLYSNQPGSWENGSKAVSHILSHRAGVNVSGMRILDGSGLSPNNLTTPAQMMQVLDYAYHHPINTDFISSLPIAGVDGTLKHRMYNIARKVRAKTGTISGVISLAGYADAKNKEPLAFVIMINGRKGFGWRYKSIEDKIATALTRYSRTY